jgi:hypothetical protein
MKRLFFLFNGGGVILGSAGIVAMLTYVNLVAIESGRFWVVLGFLLLMLWLVWSVLALVGFGVRRLLTNRTSEQSKRIAQRQGFLLALFLTLNLLLQGELLWNPFSSVILAVTIIMIEAYFLQRKRA